jgi:hypothetical protein
VHHLVLVAGGAGGEHRHPAVARDAAVAAGLDHARDRGLRIERRCDLVHGAGDHGVLEAVLAGIDDDRERIGAEAGERALDRVARRDRLGPAVLPAGAGQLILGAGSERQPEDAEDERPEDDDEAPMRCAPEPEPPDGADR